MQVVIISWLHELCPTGTAKAWVNLNQDGTHSVRGSNNVSSVSDEGVGATQTNLTSQRRRKLCFAGTSGDEAGNSGCWHSTGYNVNSTTLLIQHLLSISRYIMQLLLLQILHLYTVPYTET